MKTLPKFGGSYRTVRASKAWELLPLSRGIGIPRREGQPQEGVTLRDAADGGTVAFESLRTNAAK
jgi:hypothetical protein